jgi:hypothetical protein
LFATSVTNTSGKFAAGVVDAGDKFAASINSASETGEKKLPPVLLTTVANLIPVVHLELRISPRIF